MFCGEIAISGLPPSVSPVSASFDFWIVAEIAKVIKERRSQPPMAIPIHLSQGRPFCSGSRAGAGSGGLLFALRADLFAQR